MYVFQHCISGMNMHERDQCVCEAAVWLWSGETILLSERAGGCGLVFGCLSALRQPESHGCASRLLSSRASAVSCSQVAS